MNSTPSVVESLKAKQRAFGESDYTFAQRLGVNRETWRIVRTGQQRPGRLLLSGVTRAFPELQLEVAQFLRDSARILNHVASEVNR